MRWHCLYKLLITQRMNPYRLTIAIYPVLKLQHLLWRTARVPVLSMRTLFVSTSRQIFNTKKQPLFVAALLSVSLLVDHFLLRRPPFLSHLPPHRSRHRRKGQRRRKRPRGNAARAPRRARIAALLGVALETESIGGATRIRVPPLVVATATRTRTTIRTRGIPSANIKHIL